MEIWTDIPSLPEYLASSFGRVMCRPFEGVLPSGHKRQYGGKPSFGVTHAGNGMRPTILYKGKNFRVSRLICEAFHGPAPFPRAVVMHLDNDQTNNRIENLKWGSQKENLNAGAFLLYCRGRIGENNPANKGRAKKARLSAA